MRLLVKIPSRSRPEAVARTAREFLMRARQRPKVIVSLDEDDPTLPLAKALLGSLGVTLDIGRSSCKVEAVNRGIPASPQDQHDVIIVAADDQCPVPAYDMEIRRAFAHHFPNYDGAIHFNDGHVGEKLCTIPVMGARFYRKFGYVYHPDYLSLWCDNEQTDVYRAMGRMPYVKEVVIRHNHPSYTGKPKDALLERNEGLYERDRVIYEGRKGRGFESPEILLSILIPSLRTRAQMLIKLLAELNRQIDLHDDRRAIELWVDQDQGQVQVGRKRSRLLEKAKGRFVCFIDDDDMVAPCYVADIIAAIKRDPTVDCIGIEGVITTNGTNAKRFVHTVASGGCFERDNVYWRTPNHLNPVRTDLARAAGFPPLNCGEDAEYMARLAPVLKRETMIADKPLYYYRFDTTRTATQRTRPGRR